MLPSLQGRGSGELKGAPTYQEPKWNLGSLRSWALGVAALPIRDSASLDFRRAVVLLETVEGTAAETLPRSVAWMQASKGWKEAYFEKDVQSSEHE